MQQVYELIYYYTLSETLSPRGLLLYAEGKALAKE